MPAWKIITQIIAKKTRIAVVSSDQKKLQEITKQLQSLDSIQLIDPDERFDVLVYVLGFGQLLWSEVLNHTTRLHALLETSLAHRAKFILVTPPTHTPFLQVATTMTTQFTKNFKLTSKHILVNLDHSDAQVAEQIIASLIKGYKRKEEPVPPLKKPDVVVLNKPVIKAPKKSRSWIWLWVALFVPVGLLSLWMGLWLLSIVCLAKNNDQCVTTAFYASRPLAPLARNWPTLAKSEAIIVRAHRVAQIARQVSDQSSGVFAGIFTPIQPVTREDLSDLVHTSNQLLDDLAYLQADLKQLANQHSLLAKPLNTLYSQLTERRHTLNKLNLINGDLQALLAIDTVKHWALLVQDHSELRPTGGFIEGVVVGQMDAGQVSDLQVFDVAQIDAQFKGQVDPPADLKQYLGETTWLLRDSNWDPDFEASAAKAAWFLHKEIAVQPDIVIAVTTKSIREFLDIVGGVELPEVGRVTYQNFYTKQEQYYKAKSLSGRFGLALFEQVLAKRQTLSENEIRKLAQLLFTAFDNRQIVIATPGFDTRALSQVGWTGQLVRSACLSVHPCVAGSLYPVDANIGLNKANLGVTRQHALELTLDTKQVVGTYTVQITNANTQTGWPLGAYKNYLRVYLAEQVVVDQVRVDGQPLTTDQYQVRVEKGGVVVAVAQETAIQTSLQLSVVFRKLLPLSDKFHLQWELFNQPGTDPEPWMIVVNYPPAWLASSQDAYTVASPGLFRYNLLLPRPFILDLDFTQWKNTP